MRPGRSKKKPARKTPPPVVRLCVSLPRALYLLVKKEADRSAAATSSPRSEASVIRMAILQYLGPKHAAETEDPI